MHDNKVIVITNKNITLIVMMYLSTVDTNTTHSTVMYQ